MAAYKLIVPSIFIVLATALFGGCQRDLTQSKVNEKQREADQAVAKAEKQQDQIRHETRKAVIDAEQARREKVGQAEDKLRANPDADQPRLKSDISTANREAEEKTTKIREKAADQQEAVREKASEKVQQANKTAAKFEAQQTQKQYVADHEKMLQDYDANIVLLKKQRDNLAGDALKRFDERLARVNDGRKKASDALAQLKSARPDEWGTFRDEVQRAFANLKTAYEEAAQRNS